MSANFLRALGKTLVHEGYWGNNPLDKGGETYQGISRRYHPNWTGWPLVDRYKQQQTPSARAPIPGLERYVQDFYHSAYWKPFRCEEIQNPNLQDLLFDFFMGSGQAVRVLQQTLNREFGTALAEDNRIGPLTLQAINKAPSFQLFEAVKNARIRYYQSLSDWKHFGRGWTNRVARYVWEGSMAAANLAAEYWTTLTTIGLAILAAWYATSKR